MQRKSRRLLILVTLLFANSCFTVLNKKYMENKPTDINSFSDYLYEIRENGISLDEAKQAKSIAKSISDKIQSEHALLKLRKEISKYGSNQAKLFYGDGSELRINDFFQSLSNDDLNYLNGLFKDTIKISNFKKLPIQQQNEIINILKKVIIYYSEIAKEKESYTSKEKNISETINNFLEYINYEQ